LVLAVLIAAGMNPIASFFIICWMFFWGIPALADGLGKWLASASEMKALEQLRSQGLLNAPREQITAGPVAEISSVPRYSTDPINVPGSVTENTTRHLEEGAYRAEGPKEKQ
jgi:hypothetical protein